MALAPTPAFFSSLTAMGVPSALAALDAGRGDELIQCGLLLREDRLDASRTSEQTLVHRELMRACRLGDLPPELGLELDPCRRRIELIDALLGRGEERSEPRSQVVGEIVRHVRDGVTHHLLPSACRAA